MIRTSSLLFCAALAVSAALHMGGTAALWDTKTVHIEGGTPASLAALGNSFQDVAQGVQTPVETPEVQESLTVEDMIQPERTVTAAEPASLEPLTATVSVIRPLEPQALTDMRAVTPRTQTALAAPVLQNADVTAQIAVQPAPVTRLEAMTVQQSPRVTARPAEPLRAADMVSAETAQEADASTAPALPPPRADALPEEPPQRSRTETIPEPDTAALTLSRRPQERPRAVEEAARQPSPQPPTAAAAPKPKPPARRGDTAPEQRAGATDGQQAGRQAETSDAARAAQTAGNAAVTNYSGKVARKLRPARRMRAGVKGEVLIRFKISWNGDLEALKIVRSSGSKRLDDIARRAVRKAAPFPKPPQGAQRVYVITVKGR